MSRALLVGATGLVGGCLLRRLLANPSYEEVEVLVRRRTGITHPKLVERIVDFDRMAALECDADHVFCCLGTTIAKAGSQVAFQRVDRGYVEAVADLAVRGRAICFVLVSAMGADPASLFFYSRVKGEAEAAVRARGIPRTYILRPSLLMGPREEMRLGERASILLARVLAPVMIGPLRNYRAVSADDVAAAMIACAAGVRKPGIVMSEYIPMLARASASPRK